MRFLCFHGLGTNAQIFEKQTDILRSKIPGDHEFIFLDGDFEVHPAEGIGAFFAGPYYSWVRNPPQPRDQDFEEATEWLHDYIEDNGPFDGAMGFSQGSAVIFGYLLDHQRKYPSKPPPFQIIILINAVMPDALQSAVAQGLQMPVSTAHIIGGPEDQYYKHSLLIRDSCPKDLRTEFEHSMGHQIPTRPDLTEGMAKAMNGAIAMANERKKTEKNIP